MAAHYKPEVSNTFMNHLSESDENGYLAYNENKTRFQKHIRYLYP